MPAPHLVIVKDPAAIAHAALRLFVGAAARAIEERGAFSVALAGGSTPKAMYELLAHGEPTRPRWPFDWNRVHVFFGDERCVPPDDHQSNYKMAHDALLSRVPLPPTNIHRMRGEIDANEAAREYGQTLKRLYGDGGLDLVLLGMGDDGHTASLFPHQPVLDEQHHRAVGYFAENSSTGKSWRISMTASFINRAREVAILVAGAAKAERLAEVLEGPRDPHRLPIQLIEPAGKLIWILDEPAAGKLKKP